MAVLISDTNKVRNVALYARDSCLQMKHNALVVMGLLDEDQLDKTIEDKQNLDMSRLESHKPNPSLPQRYQPSLKSCPFCNTPILSEDMIKNHLLEMVDHFFVLIGITKSVNITTEEYQCAKCNRGIQLRYEQYFHEYKFE